jgi:hypothetical protein
MLLRIAPLILGFVFCFEARANIGDTYGFGSRAAGLAGATAGWGFDGFAAYSNPAAIGLLGEGRRFSVGLGTVMALPNFLSIGSVVTENSFVSDLADNQTTVGSVDTNYRTTIGTVLGLAYRIAPNYPGFTVGLTAYLPFEAVAYMDTGESFLPEYVLYRARTHRPQVDAGFSAEIIKGLRIGIGGRVGFSLSSNAQVFLKTTAGHPSTMRFTASLQPKIAPYGGLLYSSDDDPRSTRPGSFSIGTVVRGPLTSTNQMVLRANAQLFSTFASLGFNFTAASALFYDPLTVELGGSVQYSSFGRIYAQIEYQGWGQFESPALTIGDQVTIDNCTPGNPSCGVILQPGRNPSAPTQDLVVPRIAHELTFGDWSIRTGYSYRASIFRNLPTGSGNFLDPPKHMLALGLGYEFKKAFLSEVPVRIDAHFHWHQLETQSIVKDPGNELGQGTENTKIGAPSYRAGGKILGGGISLSLAL